MEVRNLMRLKTRVANPGMILTRTGRVRAEAQRGPSKTTCRPEQMAVSGWHFDTT